MNSKDKEVRPQQGETPATACDRCGNNECSAAQRKKGESEQDFSERRELESRLCRIRRKLVVLSGKGGVGKSTVAVNIAAALQMAGKRVGLLDVDIHGPSIPTMLGLEGAVLQNGPDGLLPVDADGVKVMSLGFLLPDSRPGGDLARPPENGRHQAVHQGRGLGRTSTTWSSTRPREPATSRSRSAS